MATGNAPIYDDVEQLVDLRAVWVGLRRQAGLFAAVAATLFLATLAYVLFSQEQYTAETSLVIEPKSEIFAYSKDMLTRMPADPVAVDTEVELLRSRAMALRVAQRLAAGETASGAEAIEPIADAPGDESADVATLANSESSHQPVSASAVSPLTSDIGLVVQAGPVSTWNENTALVPSSAVDALMANLQVERVGSTSFIKLRFKHPSAQRAAEIANAYAEEYIGQQVEFQNATLQQANAWIDTRLQDLRREVRTSEQEAAIYRATQGLVEARGGTSLAQQRIEAIADELTAARSNLTTLRTRYNTVVQMSTAASPIDTIGEAMASAIMADLRRQRTELHRKIAEFKVRYGELHPELRKAREEAQELDAQIDLHVRRIVDSIRAEYEFAGAQVRMLERDLADMQTELAANSTAMAELEDLQRNIEAPKGVYEALLNRRKELNERDSLAKANARIVAHAVPPDAPSEPRRALLLGGGFVLALLFGSIAAFTSEMLDTRIKNTSDIRREFGPAAPVVLVPRVQSRRLFHQRQILDVVKRFLIDEPSSKYAESMRDLRMHLKAGERSLDRKGGVAVAFASISRDAGTTMTAFSFAVLLANGGKRVAFVDCARNSSEFFADGEVTSESRRDFGFVDSDRPRVIEESAEEGAATVFERVSDRRQPAASALVPSAEEVADGAGKITPVKPRGAHHSDALIVRNLKNGVDILHVESSPDRNAPKEFDVGVYTDLIDAHRADYDYVVVDTPAVMANAEANIIAGSADFVFLLAEWCSTTREAARVAVQRLIDARARILSFVITKVDEKQRIYFRPEDRHFYFRNA